MRYSQILFNTQYTHILFNCLLSIYYNISNKSMRCCFVSLVILYFNAIHYRVLRFREHVLNCITSALNNLAAHSPKLTNYYAGKQSAVSSGSSSKKLPSTKLSLIPFVTVAITNAGFSPYSSKDIAEVTKTQFKPCLQSWSMFKI